MSSPTVLLLALVASSTPPASSAPVPPPVPFQTKVEDPMLAPVPPASQQVGTWEQALALVRERSTNLRTAEAGVQRAEGRWRQALAALLPNARASASAAHDFLNSDTPVGVFATPALEGRKPTTPIVGTVSASLSQSLVDVGAWRNLSSNAAAERGAVASLQDMRRRLTLGLARSLVATVAAERAAELNRVGLLQALERSALTTRSFDLGASNQLDVVRVNQDVALARGSLVAGDEQLRRAREALGIALGFGHAVGVASSFNLNGLMEDARKACTPLEDLESRPDLVSARAQVESSRDSRRQASAGYLPTLGLTSNLQGVTTDPDFGRFSSWSIAAVLSVPIWEGGLRGGLVREREGIEKQAEQTLESNRRDASVEVEQARRGVDVAQALVKTASESRELADRTDRLTRRSFEVGRGSSLELVQSGAALRQAELTLALREFELVQARLDAFLTEARCDW
ncbi:HAE1 family efflux transporter outer membrane efflux protein [Myxococcus stipitatus DSM 14675]|uniref:HAE1 family efflux transporter outer membrane efflux protein n=1 Tax=Myxococcus stipitatus (strain DSM 14675 / JCM 12634 / Mx s8) TaxID=1278073 RepID=L7UFI7_MYXSD|nr:HAE1 family efflux transporter outer membrane efflux protein [Myxococcus stipitatus DSM 14675]